MTRHGFEQWGLTQVFCDAEGGGAGGGTGGAGDGDKGKDQVTMTTAELDALIEGRVNSAVALATKKAGKGMSDAEKTELEERRKKDAERELKDKEARGQYDAALKSQEDSLRKEYEPKLTEAQERAKALHEKLLDKTIGVAVVNAAAKFDAVNPERVKRLLSQPGETVGYIKTGDDDDPIVVDAAGSQRFVAGKPMSPEQLVKEYLDQNPNEVKSKAGAGGGAGGGKSLTTGDPTPVTEQEAKIKALEEKYTKTRDIRVLTDIRLESEKLRKLKAAAA